MALNGGSAWGFFLRMVRLDLASLPPGQTPALPQPWA
jgi:hypothetical protein